MKRSDQLKTSLKAVSVFLSGVLNISSIAALLVIGLAAWWQIRAMIDPQPGMEYMFIVFAPVVLVASIVLFLNGIILFVHAIRRRNVHRANRIITAVIGLVFILPASYLAYGHASYEFVKDNAKRITPNHEVLQLVQECKIDTIRREYALNAVAYLKDSAKSRAEKNSYFYGYRSFDPEYYDELAKVVLSDEVQRNCGEVELYDERREYIPITYNWATKEEALTVLDACKIRDVHTVEKPSDAALKLASNSQSASARVFMILDPIAEGYSGTLYISDVDRDAHNDILDFARSKKGSCRYKQPNIDGLE